MKYNYLLITACLIYVFTACKPEFNLNAPYKDVPVVYGILDYQAPIQYVKIYKGFQSNGNLYLDAQNKDSIYYYDDIRVVLQEYENEKRTSRPDIELKYTHDFPRDSGMFYYGDERIIYYTTERLYPDKKYKIEIKNLKNGNVITGSTAIVGELNIEKPDLGTALNLTTKNLSITFNEAKNAFKEGYEFHVTFKYFEVERATNRVIDSGKIVKRVGGAGITPSYHNGYWKLEYIPTFYDELAGALKTDSRIIRYPGTPTSGHCIYIEGCAASEDLVNFILSNKPTSGFVQINKIYTNLTAKDTLVFGFLSSRSKTMRSFTISEASVDSLVTGSKTRHLGFRPRYEYNP